jgi:parallel beta-helix repeat protein
MNPGDTMFFKRGQIFRGNIIISKSGTIFKPIVFTGYGSGSLPEIISTGGPVFLLRNVSNIIVDGFKITDPSISDSLHVIQSKIPYAIVLRNAPNCFISNCDISKVGVGISLESESNYSTITGNFIHDLRMVRNTPSTINSNDDFGANPIVIHSSKNIISYNRFEECWARSHDYGFDGGAIELFGMNVNDNRIEYNTAINCNAFLEIGSQGNGSAWNNIVAYNKIINCGATAVLQNSGNFKIDIRNLLYYNNTIVEVTKKYSKSVSLFWMADNGIAGMITLKNNIFWLSSGVNLVNSRGNKGQIIHENNIYRMSSGSLFYKLNSSEQFSTSMNHFTNTKGDPSNWNLELLPLSTAINAGVDLGFKKDFNKKSILNAPDIGSFEFHPINEKDSLVASAYLSRIKCNGDSTELKLTAKGGVPPYIGVGTYSVKAGTYNYRIKDNVGDSTMVSILVLDPDPISLEYNVESIQNQKSLYRLNVKARGGISPYLYSLNDSEYQSNGQFDSVLIGVNKINILDSIGCIESISIILDNQDVNHQVSGIPFLSIRPNPSNGAFLLLLKQTIPSIPFFVDVYDFTGRVIFSQQIYRDYQVSFGNDLIPGIYFVRIVQDGKLSVVRIIKT